MPNSGVDRVLRLNFFEGIDMIECIGFALPEGFTFDRVATFDRIGPYEFITWGTCQRVYKRHELRNVGHTGGLFFVMKPSPKWRKMELKDILKIRSGFSIRYNGYVYRLDSITLYDDHLCLRSEEDGELLADYDLKGIEVMENSEEI